MRALTSLAGLPIFPLPRVVLLPGELLPLHVFEPRYRALVRTVMEGDRLLGMATLMSGYEMDYEGAPSLHPELGIGRVVRHEPLHDGRSNILVAWVASGRITTEIETAEPFRRVDVEIFPDVDPSTCTGLSSLRHLAIQVSALVPNVTFRQELFELEGPPFVDALARLTLHDADERRAYLAAKHGGERVRLVQGALLSRLADGPAADEA